MSGINDFPPPCPVGNTLDNNDWQKIILALETYVIHEETALKNKNAGDREWQKLEEFNTLIRDIQLYCIGRDYV